MRKQIKFSRLSKAQKRVAIAQDAIQQIKAGQFQIEDHVWAELLLDDGEDMTVNQQALLVGKPVQCKCCAVGACFLSSMRLDNRAEFNSTAEQNDAYRQLKRYFSKDQINQIEAAFELGDGAVTADDDDEKYGRAIRFGRRFKNQERRAIGIFKNIIRHGGQFVP